MAFGQRLRVLRQANGWTQEEVAWRSGLSTVTISRLEQTGDPTKHAVGTLEALADTFGITLEQLLGKQALDRLSLSDADWHRVAAVLERIKPKAGSPPQQSDRMFIEAVLYVNRTGIGWRHLPEVFGKWDAVYNRYRRWEKNGVWRRLRQEVPQVSFPAPAGDCRAKPIVA
jgi:transcriptional regulator with XRE-family HTH domain